MTKRICAFVLMMSAAALAADKTPTARLGGDAALRLDGDDARLQFVLAAPDGGVLEPLNEMAAHVASDLSVIYKFIRAPKSALAGGRATLRAQGPSAVFAHALTAHMAFRDRTPCFILRLNASLFRGLEWKAGDKVLSFPAAPEKSPTLGEGGETSFEFAFPGGRKWKLAFPKSVKYEGLDMRRRNLDEFTIRFTLPEKPDLTVGKGFDTLCTLSASDGKVRVAARDFHGIAQGAEWVKLEVADGIRPSSALDFSRLAGRRSSVATGGPLVVTTNGEFRTARKASAPLRLFGCRVGGDDLFAAKKASAEYTKSLARIGYNAIRISRYQDRLMSEGAKGLRCDNAQAEKLDQLVTGAGRDGIYSILDIAGARPWTWGDLALVAPGGAEPSPNLSAMLFLGSDRALESWKRYATAVYGRRNVVGRRNYSADPAVPLVLALADTCPFGAWKEMRTLPSLRERYGRWLKEKRKADPDFMAGKVCEEMDFGIMPLHETKAASIRLFLAECEVGGLAKMKSHLCSLGSKALVGATLGAHHFRDVAALRMTAGDFTCDSFHLDPSRHLGNGIVCRLENANPLTAGSPLPSSIAAYERPDGAMCITSWGFSRHSPWRAMSGLLVGAWAAKHRWDALIRESDPLDSPFAAATERAACALFARGDLAPDAPDDAFVIAKGALTVKTPRTVGGFSPDDDGRIVAQPLAVTLKGARAAVWVTSLTDDPVSKSKRLLLTHLTDMRTEGTLFADSNCDLLMRRGTGPLLVRNGSATVELALEKATSFKVFVLGTDGRRSSVRVPTEVNDGVLTFVAEIRGNKNAQYLYEITRE